jgi:hypothetical protein
MATTSGQINRLLDYGVRLVFGGYDTKDEDWKPIYTTLPSDKNFETHVEVRYLGAADIVSEGQAIPSDSMSQRYTYVMRHIKSAVQTSFTDISWEDNLYKKDFPMQMFSLRQSLQITKQYLAANPFNNAFNPAFPLGDGQPLCSTAHPTDGGPVSNCFGQGTATVDLSEASLEEAIIKIQEYLSASGTLMNLKPKLLVIPRALQFDAVRILKNVNRVDTANRDINAIYNMGFLSGGYVVNNYIESKTAWFIKTDLPASEGSFLHYQRHKLKFDNETEFNTGSIKFKAFERYCFGVPNWRAIFGSPGV